LDKPLLRGTLKKLRALPFDESDRSNVIMRPQEMLDFLAMRAGVKPVALLGRGFDDRPWVEGAAALATKAGLYVVGGPGWHAGREDPDPPDWFRDHVKKAAGIENLIYVCRTKSTADAVAKSFEAITMDEEARLLGYPPCCVRQHYERDALLNRTFRKLVERAAGGKVEEMKRILAEDVGVAPETEEEKQAFDKATKFVPAKFTSFHMCDACVADAESPANRLSKTYMQLAELIGANLAAEVAKSQEGLGA
jgi:hypothetical protein